MGTYILRRLGWSVVVLFAIAVLTFFVTFILPADPARMIAGIRATPEDVERIRHALRARNRTMNTWRRKAAFTFRRECPFHFS